MRNRYIFNVLFISLIFLIAPQSLRSAERYIIDPVHTKVQFSVRHMMITQVPGEFRTFTGAIELDEGDLTRSRAEGTIEAKSINTNNEKRDNHLRSADFFHVDQFPEIRYRSTRIIPLGGNRFRVFGELTIKDVTKEIELEVEYGGKVADPMGNERMGFHAEGKINRKDFHILWNKTLDNGGVVVGDEVKLILDVEAIKESKNPAEKPPKKP